MIVSLRKGVTPAEVEEVCERIRAFGYRIHSSEGEEHVVIGAVGVGNVSACLESLRALPKVDRAVRLAAPYKFVSRKFRPQATVVRVRVPGRPPVESGGGGLTVMAGPCSVESEAQILDCALAVTASGAQLLRGGAFKPRSSPYAFQGLEAKGLRLLAQAREATGLAIVPEVMTDRDVPLVAEYADILQNGARNMQNFALLKEVGRCGRPVLLMRSLRPLIELRRREPEQAPAEFQAVGA